MVLLALSILIPPADGTRNKTLSIPVFLPTSGGWFAKLGQECKVAADLAMADINNHSILGDYELKLLHSDNRVCTADMASLLTILFDTANSVIIYKFTYTYAVSY